MKKNNPFNKYFFFIKVLFILVICVSFLMTYLVEKKENLLFNSMIEKYIQPSEMLNELKNIYDINILETLYIVNAKMVSHTDAIDILVLSKKLIDSNWDKYYSPHLIIKSGYSKDEIKNIENFRKNMNRVNEQINILVEKIHNSDSKDVNLFINTILTPNIYKVKYLLDDISIDNLFKIRISKKMIEDSGDMFVFGSFIIIFLVTLVLFAILNLIGKKMNTLNNELMNQAQELEIAMNVKSNFLANMSHEIRTPMNAILGFISILKEKETNQEKLKYINIVLNAGKSLINIISDILDYSKIESGNFVINNVCFKVFTQFDESIELYLELAKEKNISLVTEYSANVPKYMMGDNLRMKQVINNLLSNAIKFSKNNSVVNILLNYNEAKDQLCCHIVDSGIGMTQEDTQKLFTAFTQVGNAKVGISGGTGLGLSISKNLLALMNGEIFVDSILGKGSNFYFILPVFSDYCKEELIEEKLEEILDEAIDELCYENLNVLIVEDNKTNQMLLKIIFDDLGASSMLANHGQEAVDLFKESPKYDLILMDENMPIMNGSEATIEIRKIEKEKILEETIIIAVTANAMEGDKEKFLSVGMNDYLSKPMDKEKLLELINSYCL